MAIIGELLFELLFELILGPILELLFRIVWSLLSATFRTTWQLTRMLLVLDVIMLALGGGLGFWWGRHVKGLGEEFPIATWSLLGLGTASLLASLFNVRLPDEFVSKISSRRLREALTFTWARWAWLAGFNAVAAVMVALGYSTG